MTNLRNMHNAKKKVMELEQEFLTKLNKEQAILFLQLRSAWLEELALTILVAKQEDYKTD